MTSKEYEAQCLASYGNVSASEAALIAALAEMETLAIGGEGTTHFYYRDAWETEKAYTRKAEAERDSWKAMASREAQAAVEYVGEKEAAEDERDRCKAAAKIWEEYARLVEGERDEAKRAEDALDWQVEQDRDALEGMRTECDRLRATVAALKGEG